MGRVDLAYWLVGKRDYEARKFMIYGYDCRISYLGAYWSLFFLFLFGPFT